MKIVTSNVTGVLHSIGSNLLHPPLVIDLSHNFAYSWSEDFADSRGVNLHHA